MKNNDIKFAVDRTSVEEGENVMVTWECGIPDAVTLTIDNGFTKSQIQLPDSGARSVAIQHSKGSTTLRLTVAQSGKIVRKEIGIKVKNIKRVKAKAYRPSSSSGGFSIKGFFGKLGYRLRSFWQRVEYSWRVMPLRRRRIYQALFIWIAAMMVATCSHNSGYEAGLKHALQVQGVEQTSKSF